MRVLTIGSFDGVHNGHRRLFAQAGKLGELWVGVNTDRFYREYRGYPPGYDEQHRQRQVSYQAGVKRVLLNDGPGRDLILQVRPDVLAIGPDWMPPRDYLAQIGMTADELLSVCTLAFVGPPREPGLSSTALKEAA